MKTNIPSGLQLSFVTMTMFESGPAPTVTVTPLPQMITQQVTVTVTANNNVAAGVSMPGAVGTGGSKTAAIVKTSDAAAGNVGKDFSIIYYVPTNASIASGAPAAASGAPAATAAPAGVSMPGAVGTAPAGSKTAAIVKTSDAAAGNVGKDFSIIYYLPTNALIASGAPAAASGAPAATAGVSMAGAAGTAPGGSKTAAIVKTSNPAVGNTRKFHLPILHLSSN
jgi:hypothetical protein